MKWFIGAFYLFYILSGGFRHYSFDFVFFTTVLGETTSAPLWVIVSELTLMILAFLSILFPFQKYLHLAFFLLLFALDLFFQNMMSFMSCFVLPHAFPLFLFLFLHFRQKDRQRQLVLYSAMLFVAVGYLSSLISKLNS